MKVAALYIDPRGPYPAIESRLDAALDAEGVEHSLECWGLPGRDARVYDGPHPVVAHPPCGPWGQLRHMAGGLDRDCAPRAVEQVRRWGGVLEHPAGSKLWEACGLPRPSERGWHGDRHGGYTIELCQVEWGHVARKRTWLYLVGVPREALEEPPFPGREPTHWVAGRHKPYPPELVARCRKPPGVAPKHIRICSSQQRRRTPPLFAAYLVRLARAAGAAKARAA